MIAPPLFEMEVDSIVLTRFVEGSVTSRTANKIWSELAALPVAIKTHRSMRQRAREIARHFNQRKVYDSTYAALADLRGCEFWTADKRFYDAVRAGLPFVKYLPNFSAQE